jgi:hypothetical protein
MNDRFLLLSRRRVFFIAWAVFAVLFSAVPIGVTLIFAAYHPGHAYHLPPLWIFPENVLASALPAAVVMALKPSKQTQPGQG